jgi:hypothetical protein
MKALGRNGLRIEGPPCQGGHRSGPPPPNASNPSRSLCRPFAWPSELIDAAQAAGLSAIGLRIVAPPAAEVIGAAEMIRSIERRLRETALSILEVEASQILTLEGIGCGECHIDLAHTGLKQSRR